MYSWTTGSSLSQHDAMTDSDKSNMKYFLVISWQYLHPPGIEFYT